MNIRCNVVEPSTMQGYDRCPRSLAELGMAIRVLPQRPRYLLLDEPFAAIDPITRAEIHAQMLQLHAAEPTTTVLVTHDMREALLLAEHIIVIRNGRIAHSEDKASLLQRYDNGDPETLLNALLSEAAA